MGASFIICSMFYSALLLLVYFSKKRLASRENKVYEYIVVTNFMGLVITLFSYLVTLNNKIFPNLTPVINKIYLIYSLTFLMLFTFYTFLISFKKKINLRFNKNEIYKKVKGIFIKVYLIIAFALLVLPIYYESSSINKVFSYGPGSFLCVCMSAVCILLSGSFMIIERENIKKEKFIPLISYIVLLPFALYVQYKYPELMLMTSVETFITFLLYFTIENPDLSTIKELEIAKKNLEETNESKTKFLYNISHEIRTPLTNIIGFTDSLSEKQIDPSIKNDIVNIEASSNNLLQVVNGILDLSKFDNTSLKLVEKNYDLKSMLEELADFSKDIMGRKPIEFRSFFDTSIPNALQGDYVVLRQILLNILANAIERTEVGYIEFSASSIIKDNACRLIISVEDTGGIIKQSKLNNIFAEKGERVDNETLIEGVSTSLSATYKLVKLMNGEIIAQNVYGRGLKITLAVDQEVVNMTKEVPVEESIDITGKKVLIVDDNKLNIKVAERLLEKYNVEITSVLSGKDCINLINSGNRFDMILMDDMMPEMSGVQTFKTLKANPSFNIPTVMLTANAIDGMKEKYLLQDGFDEYIAKPIAKKELDRVIRKIFK